jgi:hypothetical protein
MLMKNKKRFQAKFDDTLSHQPKDLRQQFLEGIVTYDHLCILYLELGRILPP